MEVSILKVPISLHCTHIQTIAQPKKDYDVAFENKLENYYESMSNSQMTKC